MELIPRELGSECAFKTINQIQRELKVERRSNPMIR